MAHISRTTSSPRTVARPESGVIRVTRILNSVVLPPPSGPMKLNSSPGPTSNDTPSSARLPGRPDPVRPTPSAEAGTDTFRSTPGAELANDLTSLSAVTEFDIDRHPDFEQPLVVGHANLDRVHPVRAFATPLDGRRCEL